MTRIISIFISLLIGFAAFAQKQTREGYIQQYAELAVQEMHRVGIPASITLAQGCLESANGNSALSLEGNNHFGIKCHSSWGGKKMYMDDDAKGECFRVYNKAADSYIDHSDFLKNGQRYAFLFDLDITDYKAWAKGLKKAGYATNPKYADMLIKIIEDNDLAKYDSPEKNNIVFVSPENTKERTFAFNIKRKPLENAPAPTVEPPVLTGKKAVENKFERDVFKNNGVKYIIIQDDESLFMLSKKFGIPVWKLFYYNDFKPGHFVENGEIVYLSKKKAMAEKPYYTHTVAEGEDIYTISQLYGVRAEKIARINRRNIEDAIPVGTNIYVRKNMVKFE